MGRARVPEAAPVIRPRDPTICPALGPSYGVAPPPSWPSTATSPCGSDCSLPEDLEADLQRVSFVRWTRRHPWGLCPPPGDEPNYCRVIEGAWRPAHLTAPSTGGRRRHGSRPVCRPYGPLLRDRMSGTAHRHEYNAVMSHLIARHGFLPCGTIYVRTAPPPGFSTGW